MIPLARISVSFRCWCESPQLDLNQRNLSLIRRALYQTELQGAVVRGGNDWGRTSDLPLFRRTLVPTELRRRSDAHLEGR